MPALFARDTHVADDTADSSARCENAGATAPNFIELIKEFVVVRDLSELLFIGLVLLQRPIRRGCNDEMNAFIRNP